MTAVRAPIRVLIADDNRSVRKGLRLQLESAGGICIVGEVGNGIDAVRVAQAESVDVVLMDMQMPGLNGADATRQLLATPGEVPAVIVMTSFAVDGYITDAIDAGAVGYLLKSYDSDQVVAAVEAAARGEAVVSPRAIAPVLREFVRRRAPDPDVERLASLSPAERRVVSMLASGVTANEAIAAALHVSVHTVRTQLQSALRKVGVADRTQLALWGVRNGLD
ncbi:response regulator transcription factor [Microbacterium oleivorans]|uniref:response regulator transcription factor n=1 Tax=Microbacterium oleivorans TaxID=273677 RepID=UPI000767B9D3|nr:response regulator transcription factor [Microbacterium oleivorans]AZS44935.1 Transcriptional regulatory protein LiaR [Microbacterium oleivorans]THE06900.1 response regulator transcription factor [Microbacterium oleivorans]